jgi:23S rRNA G2445 N2-methylase RlmL
MRLDLVATSTFGLEAVVTRELEALGYAARSTQTGRIEFEGDASALARTNLHLRCADRVLARVAGFDAPDFEALFETTYDVPWENWIGPDHAFPVSGRSVKSTLTSVPAVQRTVKKAIVERLMRAHGVSSLPETGAVVPVEIALLKDEATLLLDTSGSGLHKRGYRDPWARRRFARRSPPRSSICRSGSAASPWSIRSAAAAPSRSKPR